MSSYEEVVAKYASVLESAKTTKLETVIELEEKLDASQIALEAQLRRARIGGYSITEVCESEFCLNPVDDEVSKKDIGYCYPCAVKRTKFRSKMEKARKRQEREETTETYVHGWPTKGDASVGLYGVEGIKLGSETDNGNEEYLKEKIEELLVRTNAKRLG